MKERACMFCGHRYVVGWSKLHKKITSAATDLIVNEGVKVFYLRNLMGIDEVCSLALKLLSLDYPDIRIYLVIPNVTRKVIKEYLLYEYMNDGIINLDFRKESYTEAMIKCDEWLVNNSDYIITHMHMNYGRAYRVLKYGMDKNKQIVRI